jgi:periplasmic copper chaperone A
MINRRHIFALPLVFLPKLAFAHSYKLGALAIGHAWAKPTSETETMAMIPIVNAGPDIDSLISATSPICDKIEFQFLKQKIAKFELGLGRPFPMRPRGPHLQLIGLKKPLVKGDVVPLTLVFEKAGKIDIELQVENSPGE